MVRKPGDGEVTPASRKQKAGVRDMGCRSSRWDAEGTRGQDHANGRRFIQPENGDRNTGKLTNTATPNTSPKAARSMKQTWKYRNKREAELFRSLGLSVTYSERILQSLP